MVCIRELFWLSVKYNFELEYAYIMGNDNTVADCISRLHEPGRFLQLEAIMAHYGQPLHPLNLRFHMSADTIYYLILQIKRWLVRKLLWTETLPYTDL